MADSARQFDPVRLRRRFVELCEIPSPTGEERAVTDYVRATLSAAGIESVEDDAAGPARAGSGNLVARLPGQGPGWLLFAAHLDTVPHEGPIQVVSEADRFRSAGDTILGADNKGGCAVILEVIQSAIEDGVRTRPIEVAISRGEEIGLGAVAGDVDVVAGDADLLARLVLLADVAGGGGIGPDQDRAEPDGRRSTRRAPGVRADAAGRSGPSRQGESECPWGDHCEQHERQRCS